MRTRRRVRSDEKAPKMPDPQIPRWVEVLNRPAMNLSKLTPADLERELGQRLVAYLESCGCEADLDGWRYALVCLAIERHPAFKVVQRQKLPVSGAPTKATRWSYKNALVTRQWNLEQDELDAGKKPNTARLQAEAARQINAEFSRAVARSAEALRDDPKKKPQRVPTAKTLQNMATMDVPFPAEWTRNDYLIDLRRVANQAAKRLP